MLAHVLIGIDFSDATPRLVARLHSLRALGVKETTLVHVLSTRYPSAPAVTHREAYEARLNEIAGEIDPAFTVRTRIETGEPGSVLVQTAGDIEADLILAGKRGFSRWRGLFLGSTALDLARLTDRPLWLEPIVPHDDTPTTRFRCVLLATDGSDSAKPAETMFVHLAGRYEQPLAIRVVTSSDDEQKQRETRDAELTLAGLAARVDGLETNVVDGEPSNEISDYAQREDVELVITGKRGRSSLQGLLLGSTAEAVCRSSQRSVLLVPAQHM